MRLFWFICYCLYIVFMVLHVIVSVRISKKEKEIFQQEEDAFETEKDLAEKDYLETEGELSEEDSI